MSSVFVLLLAAAAAGLAGGGTGAQGRLALEHAALSCVTAESFVSVSAAIEPVRELSAARVEFRASGGPWYAVPMRPAAGEMRAVLPRAGSSLPSFTYRIVAVPLEGSPVVGAEHEVWVGDRETCPSSAAVSLPSGTPVVVTIPPGAPIVPPVPPGFNPAGAIAASEASGNRPSRLRPIAAGAAAVGGLGGLVAVFGSHAGEPTGFGSAETPAQTDPVRIDLVSSVPPPGSVISQSRDALSVVLRIQALRLTLQETRTAIVEFRTSRDAVTCLRLSTRFTHSGSPQEVTVNGPFERFDLAQCEEFDANQARVVVLGTGGSLLFQTGTDDLPDLPVNYHFVP